MAQDLAQACRPPTGVVSRAVILIGRRAAYVPASKCLVTISPSGSRVSTSTVACGCRSCASTSTSSARLPGTCRNILFRDWLREHPEGRQCYEQAKRAAIPGAVDVIEYNARKEAMIRDIYQQVFRAADYFPNESGNDTGGENPPSAARPALDRKMVLQGLSAATGTVVVLFALMFGSASTWDWRLRYTTITRRRSSPWRRISP